MLVGHESKYDNIALRFPQVCEGEPNTTKSTNMLETQSNLSSLSAVSMSVNAIKGLKTKVVANYLDFHSSTASFIERRSRVRGYDQAVNCTKEVIYTLNGGALNLPRCPSKKARLQLCSSHSPLVWFFLLAGTSKPIMEL